ncbi:MAG: FCSD flavin-binding domain-containing protein [Burkholderiaceae bacterium]
MVGGGFAGATCARYLKLWAPAIDVTLVEPQKAYVPCPMSNRLLGGTFNLRDLMRDYGALSRNYGVRVVHDQVTAVDLRARSARLERGDTLPWDRLVLAAGIDFDAQRVAGLASALQAEQILHAWRGGSQQIWELRKRIDAMPAGGVVALHVPKAPYRCPPGPYERASLIAHYLQHNNPRAKVLLFDANPDVVAKKGLFVSTWKERYAGVVEYVPNADLTEVSGRDRWIEMKMQGRVKADVINIIPPNRAPALAARIGLTAHNGSWCPVDFTTYESTLAANVHIIGDGIESAPGLPKSGHLANQTAKVCAAAIAARYRGDSRALAPVIANTCYSFVDANSAMHVAAVYRYDNTARTMVPVKESTGTSAAPNAAEGVSAIGWAHNLLADTFGSTFALLVQ